MPREETESAAGSVAAPSGAAVRAAPRYARPFAGGEGLLALAALAGIGAGIAAVILHGLIRLLEAHVLGDRYSAWSPRWLMAPVAGNVLVAAILRRFAPDTLRNGVAEVILALAKRGGRLRPRSAPLTLLCAGLSIGTGGSVGPEGPIVHAGASVGSSLGQWLGLPPHALRTLAGCGAAGGIAAIFNAPIAGVLFAAEVVLGHFAVGTVVPLVIAAAVAAATARAIIGGAPAFSAPAYGVLSAWGMGLHLVIGVAGGLVSAGFIRAVALAERAFDRLGGGWAVKAITGGAFIALVGTVLPEALGAGYRPVTEAIRSEITARHGVAALLAIALVKVLATAVTLASGGTGGVFAPSLVIGSALGAALGAIGGEVLRLPIGPSGAFALVGMATIVAGSMRSPVGGMMIVFEMTGDYSLILPLMLASTISTWIASRLEPESLYTGKLVRIGERFRPKVDPEVLAKLEVRDALEPACCVPLTASLDEIAALLRKTAAPAVAVVDGDARLRGLVRPVDLDVALRCEPELRAMMVAADVVGPESYVAGLDDDLTIVYAELALSEIGAVPVADASGRLVGIVRHQGLMRLYRRAVLDRGGGASPGDRAQAE
jgi:CIC family chloride channel protein